MEENRRERALDREHATQERKAMLDVIRKALWRACRSRAHSSDRARSRLRTPLRSPKVKAAESKSRSTSRPSKEHQDKEKNPRNDREEEHAAN